MAVACYVFMLRTMDTIFPIVLFVGFFQQYLGNEIREYCAADHFRAACPRDQVIVIQNAAYGRMKIGKCIDEDLGHLGCSGNALKHLDNRCSGRESCELVVGRNDIPVVSNCPKHFVQYLEVSFVCATVFQFQCTDRPAILNQDVVLSSETLAKCGASGMVFEAKPGQRLNISAQYFDWDETSTGNCRKHHGTIRDSISSNSAVICSGNQREAHVMVSNGNSIEIRPSNRANDGAFLLHIKVLGCGDISAPKGGWVQREGDTVSMGCHSGKHTWTLRCEGNVWQGVSGQCGTDIALHVSEPDIRAEELMGLSPGILVFAVCSVLIFLSAVIFTLGVCIHVKRSPKPDSEQTKQVTYEDQRHFLTMHPGNYSAQTGTMPMNINR